MSLPSRATTVLRGLRARGGSSVMILVVALVAVAAATVGPSYDEAARTSIVRDTVAGADVLGRGFSVVQTGPVSNTLPLLESEVRHALPSGSGKEVQGLFQPPIESIEATAVDPALAGPIPIDWRSGVCSQLQLAGACPTSPDQVIISASFAKVAGWGIGRRVSLPGPLVLTVTGIYQAPRQSDDYWFNRQLTYFPYEYPQASGPRGPPVAVYDAMFTTEATLAGESPDVQGTLTYNELLAPVDIQAKDVGLLSQAMTSLVNNNALEAVQAIPSSDIPATMKSVTAAWTSLAVPIFLITIEVLSLAWLLLFVLITEAVTGRGADVALAKLRGYGRIRSVALAVSEPVTLLIAAFPLGALAGWGAAVTLARVLLIQGTPVALSGLGWAAAAGSTAGGFVAVVVAARRIVRQPVLNLWRRAGLRITDRGWVLDGILMTGAVAGIVQLELSGEVSSTRHSALSLLVPGLLGLAVAVVASRALPIACRAAASAGRSARRAGKRGGLAWFLALRHIGRRPGGARTTIMLATSFALATFALAAWAVGEVNYRRVATAQVGAPTVLTVSTSQGHSLSDLVTQADPSGHVATPVEEYTSNDVETLAVDPASWLSVTGLGAGGAGRAGSGARAGAAGGGRPGTGLAGAAGGGRPGTGLAGAAGGGRPGTGLAGVLDPPAAPSLILTGDQVQVSATASGVRPADDDLTMDVVTATGEGTTPIDLGVIPDDGPFTATGQLATCPCRVVDFAVVPAPSLSFGDALTGTITFASMAVHDGSGWRSVDAAFSALSRWRAAAGPPAVFDNLGKPIPLGVISLAGRALEWTFGVTLNSDAVLSSADHPESLPAIVAAKLADSGQFSVPGLDGTDLAVTVVATEAAIPGAPANGVVVDQRFAELAADNNLDNVIQQVWLAKGATATIVTRLEAEGVAIDSTADRVGALDRFHRQGPGLASVLFLAEGAAAAALAAGGAILGLYLSARRRRYEYAALTAAGLSQRTLRRALAAEQIAVLAFGMIVGVATGLVAAAVALPAVPEFVTVPLAPALTHRPPAGEMALVMAAAVLLVLVAAGGAAVALTRGVRLEQLREAPA